MTAHQRIADEINAALQENRFVHVKIDRKDMVELYDEWIDVNKRLKDAIHALRLFEVAYNAAVVALPPTAQTAKGDE